MTAIEWLLNEMFSNGGLKREQGVSFVNKKLVDKAIEMERNQIIRACNYSEMKHDELLKQAIEERKTIGEVYYDKIIKTK